MITINKITDLISTTEKDLEILTSKGYFTDTKSNRTTIQDLKNKRDCIEFLSNLDAKEKAFKETCQYLKVHSTYVYNGFRVLNYREDIILRLEVIKLEKRLKGLKDYRKCFKYFQEYKKDTKKYKRVLTTLFGLDIKTVRENFIS